MKKRWFSVFLALCMLAAAAGCSDSGETAGSDSSAAAEESSSAAEETSQEEGQSEEEVDPYGPVSDEKVEIHVGRAESANVSYLDGENSENNYVVRYLEEQLNVDYIYDFSTDDSSYKSKVAMTIASGDMPDVMNVDYVQLSQLVNADMIEDMTDVFKTYCSESLRKCFDSTNGIAESLATFDGKLMAIPDIQPGMDSIPMLYVRGDWMEELNLDEPETLDDVVEIAKTFLEKNPGGNVDTGIAVSQDIVQTGGGSWQLNSLFSMNNAYPQMWIQQDDGSVVYGSITDEAKQSLETIRGLVEDGVLDASLATRQGDQCQELVNNGQAGMFFGAWWSYQSNIVPMLEGADDSVYWNAYLAPVGDDGKLNSGMKSPTSTYVVVKKGCSEEIKEAVVKTINYQYDLDQSQALELREDGLNTPFSWHYYPINVLHCDYDAKENQIQAVMDCIDGKVEYDDLSGDGKTWYDGYTTVQKEGLRKAFDTNISTANAWGWATGAWTVQSQNDKINRVYEATYAESPSMETLWASLETLEDEYYLQVIVGDASLDDWDDFVNQWKALGGDTITQEITDIVNAG